MGKMGDFENAVFGGENSDIKELRNVAGYSPFSAIG